VIQSYPLHSLIEGSWFKLICGASYQHLPTVRSLALVYSLAGADCIDVAADPAVVTAAQAGIRVAQELQKQTQLLIPQKNYAHSTLPSTPLLQSRLNQPWLMVSINDGEDPHFRKAKFDPNQCPKECSQPCVQICPADAIDVDLVGVINDLCYGCGRCVPICPKKLITTNSQFSSTSEMVSLIKSMAIDAIEIHTQVGHYADFKRLWQDIYPIVGELKLLAISCTDGENVLDYLRSLYELIKPLPCPLIWQTDGRSMSGDIGKGTTHAAIAFANKVLPTDLPGYIQLAGGTNDHTVEKLRRLGLTQSQSNQLAQIRSVSGIAYGSYARAILSPILNQLDTTELQNIQPNLIKSQPMNQLNLKLEQDQKLLELAVCTAKKLVNQIKKPVEAVSSYKL
jgi:Fe-S-cluster-containing hydrogenase component 2